MSLPEPWLRETALPCHPAIAAVVFALRQAQEDLERFTPPAHAYFHLRHIAGSLDRLCTYLEGGSLTAEQLATLQSEEAGHGESLLELRNKCALALMLTEERLLSFSPEQFSEPRFVGRKRIQTTAIGLIIHIAEHTQRHIGELIAYSRVG